MTTHQLAGLLEHLQLGFGDSLKSGTGFAEAIVALRESPDQTLKELAKKLASESTPRRAGTRTSGSTPVDLSATIQQIRSIRDGTTEPSSTFDLGKMTAPQLKEVLRAFQQPQTGTKPTLVSRVRQLCVPSSSMNGSLSPTAALDGYDPNTVEEGVRLFGDLRDNRTLSISDVRAKFERFRGFSKSVIEEISRRLKYTPHGSRSEMIDRLLSNLESIKVSQYKMDQILTGT